VRNIAFSRGIVTIKDIDLDDGVWEVVGFDSYGAMGRCLERRHRQDEA
jgi:hypothetical protein